MDISLIFPFLVLRLSPSVLANGTGHMRYLRAILDAYSASPVAASSHTPSALPSMLTRTQPHYPIGYNTLLSLFNPNVFLPSGAAVVPSLIDLDSAATSAQTTFTDTLVDGT